jgi:hypothetical protein
MIELENHDVVIPNEIMDLGNSQQWLLKSLSEWLMGNYNGWILVDTT